MPDRHVLAINSGWAVCADRQQWMLARSSAKGSWKPIRWIGGTKASLVRFMREAVAVPTASASSVLGAWPSTFLAWRAATYP